MKKALSLVLLTGFMSVSFVPAFAEKFYKKSKYLKKIILSQSCSVMIADGKVF